MTILNELQMTSRKLASKGKGILAADESTATISKRFEANHITCDEESRRAYRELLFTTPHLNKFIAGIILFEETLKQKSTQGLAFPLLLKQMDILSGIKVDKGLVTLANTTDEKITQGLDGLPERLAEYKSLGATFAKWRAVYNIDKNTPSFLAIETNAEVLARYAAICQSQGIVPIVEPEVLIDGSHDLKTCEKVTTSVLHAVFNALYRHQVQLEHIILKPSMVISGKAAEQQASVKEVAKATIQVLQKTVPALVPSINFLSGGQKVLQATKHLNEMNQLGSLPWNVSFSYARALQEDCMAAWRGEQKNISLAQQALYKRAKMNSLAAEGRYEESMEQEEALLA